MSKVKVVVVDDSAMMRGVLTQLLNASPEIEVVGAAADANAAREVIRTTNPDVITLDVQMPGMSGLDFLERLMRLRPMPVVMVSAFTAAGSETTLKALELGAFDFIGKPKLSSEAGAGEYAEELAEKVLAAAKSRTQRVPRERLATPVAKPAAPAIARPLGSLGVGASGKIIFLGASTGGTEAIKVFLEGIPADCPPILVVQHMPEMFTASFAKRLDGLSAPKVIESQGGEALQRGMVYIAPGHSHLQIRKGAGGYVTELLQTPPVNRHRPSVDVLFDSAAALIGKNALGVLLTGMGKDGAEGLVKMRKAGAKTFAQDEETCVVFGMPREAILRGGADEVLSLPKMSGRVMSALTEK